LVDKKSKKKVKLSVDFRGDCAILFPVMRVIDKLNDKIEKLVNATNDFIEKAVDFLINKIPF